PGDDPAEHDRLEDTQDRPERGVGVAAPEGQRQLSGSDTAVDLARASRQVAVRIGELRSELVVAPMPLDERRQRGDDEILDERRLQARRSPMISVPTSRDHHDRSQQPYA